MSKDNYWGSGREFDDLSDDQLWELVWYTAAFAACILAAFGIMWWIS